MSRDTIREESNSEFIRHDKCNHCPSSDAVAVYADGHGHCFSCDWTGPYAGVVKLNGTKPKKNRNNYTYTKGDKNEEPNTFKFSGPGGEQRLKFKQSRNYDTHYRYTDEEGYTAFIVERQYTDETKQEKRFFPHTKWKNKIDNSEKWQSWAMPEPRTIYNLQRLNSAKQTSIIVCEGEKTADAYINKNLLPVTTWSGGAKAVLKNDWDPLLDFQTIILFPDNDEEGFTAMHKLAKHLHEDLQVALENIKIVLFPDEFPKKWDMADAVPKNIDTDAHRLATGALPYAEAIDNYAGIWKSLAPQDVAEIDREKSERLLGIAENIFYISELDEMLDINKDLLMPLKAFDNNYGYLKIGKAKKKPSTWLLEQEPEIFKRANSFEFNPKRPRGLNDVQGIPIVNRYRGPSIKPKAGDITMWKDTLIDVFDDAERAENMEQYIAWCFQNQGDKAMWAPLWISPKKGIGKNWITNILAESYGLKNFKPNLKYKHVTGKFNSWIIGSQFAIINEVFLSNNFNKKQELSEEIKDLITEPYIHIEEKFRRGFDYPNTCNFILISNHEDCMNIADDERRYYIVKCTEVVRYRDYWKPRWEWALGDGKRFLMHHLQNVKIKDPDLYKERAPITDDMKELAKRSEHPIFKWLDEHRDAETGPFKRSNSGDYKVFNYMAVATELHKTIHNLKQEGALEVVIDWCKKRSTSWDPTKYVPTKQITCGDGSRPRAYMFPPLEPTAKEYWINHLRSATNTQLGIEYGMTAAFDPRNGSTKNKKSIL
jgi:hypothetical protein